MNIPLRGPACRQAPVLLAAAVLLLFSLPGAVYAETRVPVFIESDVLHYLEAERVVEGWGNVLVRHGETEMEADYARVDLDVPELKAEGNVVLRDARGEFHAASLEYCFATGRTGASRVEMTQGPWVLEAESLSSPYPGAYRLHRAAATTCDRPLPHYRFRARSVDVIPGVSIRARHAVIYLGKSPLFYLPSHSRSLEPRPSGFVARPGYSSKNSFFCMTHYNWNLSEDLWGRWHLDYCGTPGWGAGFDLNAAHGGGMGGDGRLYLYRIDEKRSPRPGESPEERWKIHLRHRQSFSEEVSSILRIDALSDPDFNRDYLHDEVMRFDSRAEVESHRPEGSLSLAANRPAYSAMLYFNRRVNDFQTVAEEMPRASFNLRETGFGSSRFYYSLEGFFSSVNLSPGEESLKQAGLMPGLSYQGRLGPFRGNPSFRGEGFWYDENAAGERSLRRGSYELRLPITLAEGIWRVYEIPGAGPVEKIRHLALPKITWVFRPEPPGGREDIHQFAEKERERTEAVLFEIRNLLDGRTGAGETVNLAELGIDAAYDLLKDDGRWGNINADLRINPGGSASLRTRAGYNPGMSGFEYFDSDLSFRRGGWDYGAGARIYSPVGERRIVDYLAGAEGGLGQNWRLGLQCVYDADGERFKSVRIGVTRDLHCWELRTFVQRESRETKVFLALSIKDVPGPAR